MSGGKIVSTLSSGDIIELDARMNRIKITSSRAGGDYSQESNLGSVIELDAYSGTIEVRAKNSYSTVSYMSPSGIFANRAGTQCVASSTGLTQRAAICALGYGNLNKDYYLSGDTNLIAGVYGYASAGTQCVASSTGLTQRAAICALGYGNLNKDYYLSGDTNLIAGVYGYASNSGTAPAFGGYFYNLKAHGLILGIKKIFDSDGTYYYAKDTDSLIISLSRDRKIVYLPATDKEGLTIHFKQLWTGYMRIYPRSGQKIYDDSTENEYYDVGQGEELIAHFCRFAINGVNVQVWTVSKYKY